MSTSQVSIHTTEIDVTDAPTKLVTFAPTRATVTRDIEGVNIKVGANEVIIMGLDPNIDPESVRVDGYGLATITDIQAEVVPRKQQFQDMYPDEDDEDDGIDDELNLLADDDYGVDKTVVEEAQRELQSAEATLAGFKNSQDTAAKILDFLNQYGQNLKPQEVETAKVTNFLEMYRDQRIRESNTHQNASTEIALWEEKVAVARRKLDRAMVTFNRAKDKASRDVRREQEKKIRKKQQERQQKQRIIEQRRRFWSYNTSKIVVSLDCASVYVTGSSKQPSLISVNEHNIDPPPSKLLDENSINLRLTYVVPFATWSPRYELKISTPKSSAELVYRAEFENQTSETWKNSKITLSTSQTFFSGLDEKLPVLEPWHLKLLTDDEIFGKHRGMAKTSLKSKSELEAGASLREAKSKRYKTKSGIGIQPMHSMLQGVPYPPPPPPPPPAASARTGSVLKRTSALFGSSTNNDGSGPFLGRPVPSSSNFPARRNSVQEESDSTDSSDEDDNLTLGCPDDNPIAHQDSIRQDYGLTTTYDLPGQRTIEPSEVKRRHVIAELNLPSITLSYVLIPKLRPAAFLKARISNNSSVSLLRGKAGLTVDGTFLGSATLSNCEPGHFLDLSLGVDPSILVTYAKPTSRRSTTGFFSKEEAAVFTRSCWIKNTRKNEVSLTVFDQFPVSQDEQLKINILEPKGLIKEDSKTKLKDLFKDGEKGTGEAVLGKNGQVRWNIKLKPGKDVRLVLEYESRNSSGLEILEVN